MTRHRDGLIGPPSTWYAEVVLDGRAYVFVPPKERLLVLNETATLVWHMADGSRTYREVVEELLRHHPEAHDTVRADVDIAIDLLVDGGLLSPPG